MRRGFQFYSQMLKNDWRFFMDIDEKNIEIIAKEIISSIRSKEMDSLKNVTFDGNQIKSNKINNKPPSDTSNTINSIVAEIQNSLLGINKEKIQELIKLIINNKRIFIAGLGRSGLICKAFAMRLMQIGFTVFIIGETITPAIKSDDLLISVSGSGRTTNSVNIIKKAKDFGAYKFLITSNDDSPMSEIADSFILIPAPTKFQSNIDETGSQLIGSLFEQSTFILFECIIDVLSKTLDLERDEIMNRHANLE